MNKFLQYSALLCSAAMLLTSCSGEDLDDKEQDPLNAKMLTYISSEDLVGNWLLSNMHVDSAVDLNNDGESNTNLLAETSCFDVMNIHLKNDMTFTSVNSRMDFKGGETNDRFLCMAPRTDEGTWSVNEDVLTLSVNVEGSTYSHTKQLTKLGNTFSFDISRVESQQYVKDPGNTIVSGITILSLSYTKT